MVGVVKGVQEADRETGCDLLAKTTILHTEKNATDAEQKSPSKPDQVTRGKTSPMIIGEEAILNREAFEIEMIDLEIKIAVKDLVITEICTNHQICQIEIGATTMTGLSSVDNPPNTDVQLRTRTSTFILSQRVS